MGTTKGIRTLELEREGEVWEAKHRSFPILNRRRSFDFWRREARMSSLENLRRVYAIIGMSPL